MEDSFLSPWADKATNFKVDYFVFMSIILQNEEVAQQ